MKKEIIYKIGLTVLLASILAACGSSGGDDPTPAPTPTPTPEPTPDPTPDPVPDPVDPVDPDNKDPGESADREYSEQDKVSDSTYIQGAQNYVKFNSNFEPKTPTKGVYKGVRQRMEVENLHRSLDTIVLGWSKPKTSNDTYAIYLEDFDFTGNEAAENIAEVDTDGKFVKHNVNDADVANGIHHIYSKGRYNLAHMIPTGIEDKTLHIWEDNTNTDKEDRAGGRSATKTEWSGKKEGVAVVFTAGQNNYTNTANYLPKPVNGQNHKPADQELHLEYDDAYVPNHDRKDTVAEVYGHRTFVDGTRNTILTQPNLPLVNPVERAGAPGYPHLGYEGVRLQHLQYGRVTSFLHQKQDNQDATKGDFREGKALKNGTRIASWGKFGMKQDDAFKEDKSFTTKEDTYFYRGVSPSTKADIAKLAEANTVALYQGHAVTYGLDHNLHGIGGTIPNAIGAGKHFISGTHASAKVDFANKELTDGQLYNQWIESDPETDKPSLNLNKIYKDVLVRFEGDIRGNAVYGTSTKQHDDDRAGKFIGTFYGEKASELGGNVYSEVDDGRAWGAVFGAVRAVEEVVPEESGVGPGPDYAGH